MIGLYAFLGLYFVVNEYLFSKIIFSFACSQTLKNIIALFL